MRGNCLFNLMVLVKLVGRESILNFFFNMCVSVYRYGGMYVESRGNFFFVNKVLI